MMKPWGNIFRGIFLIAGIIVIAFNAQLYILCKQQQNEINTMSDQQKIEAQVNTNKFKYQQDQIEHLSKDLEDAQQQIKNQDDALADQKEESKNTQTSLVDIKAEADAIKQAMKGWQKDYVSVLAQLEKKMDVSQDEIKSLENNLAALNIPELKENIKSLKADIEKITPAPRKNVKDENQP